MQPYFSVSSRKAWGEKKKVRVLTKYAREPDGQVLLHGHQRGLVPHCQPLVILEDVSQARAVSLCQGAARTSGAEQWGVEPLAEPYLDMTRESRALKMSFYCCRYFAGKTASEMTI